MTETPGSRICWRRYLMSWIARRFWASSTASTQICPDSLFTAVAGAGAPCSRGIVSSPCWISTARASKRGTGSRHRVPRLRQGVGGSRISRLQGALDLRIVWSLDAYQEINLLEEAEVEALPTLLAARPLKRALGKYSSMIEDLQTSQGHVRKAAQEVARVRWLEAHGQELQAMLVVDGLRQGTL